ncbi:MAG TPA: hypothetical protein DCL43_13590 [Chitinophagaceae bacterium]|nr:hypothetical protein [Chitinophagaceae bacterium]HAN37509.1 hypothetical protein [Chitinophagaceae bacterium]
MYIISFLVPLVLLSLPCWYAGRWLNIKLKPKESILRFLVWVAAVILLCFSYFYVVLWIAKEQLLTLFAP